MRIWQKIKEKDTVIYNEEKYIVVKIYKLDETPYADLKNIANGKICRGALYSCKINKN